MLQIQFADFGDKMLDTNTAKTFEIIPFGVR